MFHFDRSVLEECWLTEVQLSSFLFNLIFHLSLLQKIWETIHVLLPISSAELVSSSMGKSFHEIECFPDFKSNSIVGTSNIYAMFVITVGEYFTVRFPHWSLCSFYFCAIFVITGSEYLIVRIPHPSTVLTVLLCYICDHSKWVIGFQNSTCIHGAHSLSVECL